MSKDYFGQFCKECGGQICFCNPKRYKIGQVGGFGGEVTSYPKRINKTESYLDFCAYIIALVFLLLSLIIGIKLVIALICLCILNSLRRCRRDKNIIEG